MVFCGWADSSTQHPVLMEFPSVCEIKVNGRVLEAVCREPDEHESNIFGDIGNHD